MNTLRNRQPIRAHLIQIAIISNHMNGKDTHVRGVRIFAPKPLVTLSFTLSLVTSGPDGPWQCLVSISRMTCYHSERWPSLNTKRFDEDTLNKSENNQGIYYGTLCAIRPSASYHYRHLYITSRRRNLGLA